MDFGNLGALLSLGLPGLISFVIGGAMTMTALGRRHWTKTTGRIVDGKEYTDSDGDRMYRTIVEYTDDEGVTRSFTSELSSSVLVRGKAVPVWYDPERRAQATSTNGFTGIAGAVLVGGGIMMWFAAWWLFL